MGYAILKVFRFLIRLTKRRYRTMSTRETCEAILDTFTDAQLVNVGRHAPGHEADNRRLGG